MRQHVLAKRRSIELLLAAKKNGPARQSFAEPGRVSVVGVLPWTREVLILEGAT